MLSCLYEEMAFDNFSGKIDIFYRKMFLRSLAISSLILHPEHGGAN